MSERTIKRVLAVTLAVIGSLGMMSSAAWAEGPPQTGVYECMSQDGLAPTLMFGLIDGATYGNYDGLTGHYRYDSKLRQLVFTDGPFKGLHYLRGENPDPVKGTGSMRMLDPQGHVTAINCPLNRAKNPGKHPY